MSSLEAIPEDLWLLTTYQIPNWRRSATHSKGNFTMFMATAPTHRNTVIKSYMKQVRCYPTAILPSAIDNLENPLPIRSADWHLYFYLLYGGCVLEKTKQLEFATVLLSYLGTNTWVFVFSCIYLYLYVERTFRAKCKHCQDPHF